MKVIKISQCPYCRHGVYMYGDRFAWCRHFVTLKQIGAFFVKDKTESKIQKWNARGIKV